MGISILDDEDIVMNSIPYSAYQTRAKDSSDWISFKVFKRFTEKLYEVNKNGFWYVSCSNFPENKYDDINAVGIEMATAIQPEEMGAICIDCRFFKAICILSQILQSKDERLVILSEPSEMAPEEFHKLMMIFKEWQDSNEINIAILNKYGINDFTPDEIFTQAKVKHSFIFLEKDKFPNREILNISVDFYGEFFLDYSSFEVMKMLEEIMLQNKK